MGKKNYNNSIVFSFLALYDTTLLKRKDFVNIYTFCPDKPTDDCIYLLFEQTDVNSLISLEKDLKNCTTFYKSYNVRIDEKWYTLALIKIKVKYTSWYKGYDFDRKLDQNLSGDIVLEMFNFIKDLNFCNNIGNSDYFYSDVPFIDDTESTMSLSFLEENDG